jgi:hypothetical protein
VSEVKEVNEVKEVKEKKKQARRRGDLGKERAQAEACAT